MSTNPEENTGNSVSTSFISYDKALKLIPNYDGKTETLHNFIDSVDFVYNKFDPSEIDIFQFVIRAKLEAHALNHISTLELTTWPKIRDELFKKFGEILDIHSLAFEMTKLRQNSEKALDFVSRVESHLLRIQKLIKYNSRYSKECREVLIDYQYKSALITILSGLREPLGQKIRIQNPTCITQLRNLLIVNENQQFITKQTFPISLPTNHLRSQNFPTSVKTEPGAGANSESRSPIKLYVKKCNFCGKVGHTESECLAKSRKGSLRNASNRAHVIAETFDEHVEVDVDFANLDIAEESASCSHHFFEISQGTLPPDLKVTSQPDESAI